MRGAELFSGLAPSWCSNWLQIEAGNPRFPGETLALVRERDTHEIVGSFVSVESLLSWRVLYSFARSAGFSNADFMEALQWCRIHSSFEKFRAEVRQ